MEPVNQSEMFAMPEITDVSMLDKITEINRELGYRQGVYTRMVNNGKMLQHVADRRILILQAILVDMYTLLEAENKRLKIDHVGPFDRTGDIDPE